jgi:hypothetical protein
MNNTLEQSGRHMVLPPKICETAGITAAAEFSNKMMLLLRWDEQMCNQMLLTV